MRRVVSIAVILLMLISTSACGSDSPHETEPILNDTDEKGGRYNPYSIGDSIEINDFNAYYDSAGKYDGTHFNLSFTVNDVLSVDEGVSIRETRYDTYSSIPAANISFMLTGNYDDSIPFNDVFQVGTISDGMQLSYSSDFLDENQNDNNYIYTNVEYTGNILAPYDMQSRSGKEIIFVVICYKDANGNEKHVYISANEQGIDPEPTATSELSEEEQRYQAALSAENRGYYTLARDIFGKIVSYKDAQDHYDKLNGIMQGYNGTYYGTSTRFQGVNVYLYIYNGHVKAQFEAREVSITLFDLYNYDIDSETPKFAFADSISDDVFLNNVNLEYGDSYSIDVSADGSYVVKAIDGNQYNTWDGIYNKVSGDVDLELFSDGRNNNDQNYCPDEIVVEILSHVQDGLLNLSDGFSWASDAASILSQNASSTVVVDYVEQCNFYFGEMHDAMDSAVLLCGGYTDTTTLKIKIIGFLEIMAELNAFNLDGTLDNAKTYLSILSTKTEAVQNAMDGIMDTIYDWQEAT